MTAAAEWDYVMDDRLTTEPTHYLIYIAATRERLWSALTDPAMTRAYFFGRRVESNWRAGAPVSYRMPDGSVDVSGRIIEIDPPRLLRCTWQVERLGAGVPEAIVTYEIEPFGEMCRLTMTEAHPEPIAARLIEGGRRGWPIILSRLKSLIETGRAPEVDLTAVMQEMD